MRSAVPGKLLLRAVTRWHGGTRKQLVTCDADGGACDLSRYRLRQRRQEIAAAAPSAHLNVTPPSDVLFRVLL